MPRSKKTAAIAAAVGTTNELQPIVEELGIMTGALDVAGGLDNLKG
jgi:hypothetical protein